MPEVGDKQPCRSRYKCMTEFLRPKRVLFNREGEPVKMSTGTEKTNCILPKGHDGPCENVRGETAGPEQISRDQERIRSMEAQIKKLLASQAAIEAKTKGK